MRAVIAWDKDVDQFLIEVLDGGGNVVSRAWREGVREAEAFCLQASVSWRWVAPYRPSAENR